MRFVRSGSPDLLTLLQEMAPSGGLFQEGRRIFLEAFTGFIEEHTAVLVSLRLCEG